jgi:hypothetical protein
MKRTYLLISLFFLVVSSLQAQIIDEHIDFSDTTQLHKLNMKDGSILYGRLISLNKEKLVFQTNNNEFELSAAGVESVSILNDKEKKRYARKGQQLEFNQFLTFSSTAFALKKKEWYYHSFYGISHSFERGLGKGFSVGVGLTLPFFPNVSLGYAHKVNEKFRIGVTSTASSLPTYFFSGVTIMNFTVGSPKMFLNFGGGLAYQKQFEGYSDVFFSSYFHLGGSMRVADKWFLVTDNVFYDKRNVPVQGEFTFGARKVFPRAHLDFGIVPRNVNLKLNAGYSKTVLIPLPYIAFGCKFGKV